MGETASAVRCKKKTLCVDCPSLRSCPKSVKRDKRRRRPLSESASLDLVRRAAGILSEGWFSTEALAARLYHADMHTRVSRMSAMVRARRPLNKLKSMGMVAVRRTDGPLEFTLLDYGKEVLCGE